MTLTPLSAAAHRRGHREIDRTAERYFIYRLHDADDVVLYVGRSCDVAGRIRGHFSEICHPFAEHAARKALWFVDVRRVSMIGPFAWDDACRAERAEIEALQPVGNRMHTKAHGWRPLAEGGGRYLDSA